jgi:diaminopimelate epimerase
MRMFNADGSESQMCGNGVRCVAKYVFDHGRVARSRNPLTVATGAGVKTIELRLGPDGKVQTASVDMGRPILAGRAIPTTFDGPQVVDQPLEAFGRTWRVTCVSMGNPHAVIFVDDFCPSELQTLGPIFETHPAFPERINAHFVHVLSPSEVTMWTWERGSGVTLACGTGASAVCVAGALAGRTERAILAHLPGGDLELAWRSDDHLIMTGPATEVFSGQWPD